jgi:hypothetical protein
VRLFGFPSICECVYDWLDDPINFLCCRNGLLNGVDHFAYITALLLSFPLFAFHFSSNFAVLARRGFSPSFHPFFCFFPAGLKQYENS